MANNNRERNTGNPIPGGSKPIPQASDARVGDMPSPAVVAERTATEIATARDEAAAKAGAESEAKLQAEREEMARDIRAVLESVHLGDGNMGHYYTEGRGKGTSLGRSYKAISVMAANANPVDRAEALCEHIDTFRKAQAEAVANADATIMQAICTEVAKAFTVLTPAQQRCIRRIMGKRDGKLPLVLMAIGDTYSVFTGVVGIGKGNGAPATRSAGPSMVLGSLHPQIGARVDNVDALKAFVGKPAAPYKTVADKVRKVVKVKANVTTPSQDKSLLSWLFQLKEA